MLRRSTAPAVRSAQALLAAAAVALLLTSCTPGKEEPPSTTKPSASAAPSATATTAPEGPELKPQGTAEDNLPIFTEITKQVWASDQRQSGRAYIDALVAAGFDREAMQVTEDQTTVGNPVESLQFSVRWGTDKCLVGQVGPSTGDPVTVVMDQLAEGRCLVGSTRAIDW